jgi:hypothetical protein
LHRVADNLTPFQMRRICYYNGHLSPVNTTAHHDLSNFNALAYSAIRGSYEDKTEI